MEDLHDVLDAKNKRIAELEAENKTLRTAFKANQEDNEDYLETIAELEAALEAYRKYIREAFYIDTKIVDGNITIVAMYDQGGDAHLEQAKEAE